MDDLEFKSFRIHKSEDSFQSFKQAFKLLFCQAKIY